MVSKMLMGVVALAGTTAVAHAGLTFSFADPAAGPQVSFSGGVGGVLTFDQEVLINFIVDGSSEPNAFVTNFPSARLELSLTVGAATPLNATDFVAPVSGTFRVYHSGIPDPAQNTILSAVVSSGAFLRVGSSSSVNSDSLVFGLSFVAGPLLQDLLLPGRTIAPQFDAVFTLTDVLNDAGGSGIAGPNGGPISAFTANASFSGTANVVPTPGAAALVVLGGLAASRRRR